MSFTKLHFYRVGCDYDFGSCKAFICVHAEDHYDALERCSKRTAGSGSTACASTAPGTGRIGE